MGELVGIHLENSVTRRWRRNNRTGADLQLSLLGRTHILSLFPLSSAVPLNRSRMKVEEYNQCTKCRLHFVFVMCKLCLVLKTLYAVLLHAWNWKQDKHSKHNCQWTFRGPALLRRLTRAGQVRVNGLITERTSGKDVTSINLSTHWIHVEWHDDYYTRRLRQ